MESSGACYKGESTDRVPSDVTLNHDSFQSPQTAMVNAVANFV